MSNEFMRVDLLCDGAYIVPRNIANITKYPLELGINQVCLLRGSSAGSAIVRGRDYIAANFEYNYQGEFFTNRFAICFLWPEIFHVSFQYLKVIVTDEITDIWRNFGITVVFFIGFNLIQAWAVENLPTGSNRPQINVFQEENEERAALNKVLIEKMESQRRGQGKVGISSVSSLLDTDCTLSI